MNEQLSDNYREINDKLDCEQDYLCEVGVVLAVEPPALAGKKNGTRKSEPADELSLFFFLIRPLRGFKYYLIGTKKNVNKTDRMSAPADSTAASIYTVTPNSDK